MCAASKCCSSLFFSTQANYELLRDGNSSRSSKPQHSDRSYTERHKVITWWASNGEFVCHVKTFANLWVVLINGNQCFEVKAGKVNTKYKFRSLFCKHNKVH